MLEEALSAGIMRFDTCARGVAAPTPSVLLAALAAAGEEQAVDEGAERAQEAVSSLNYLRISGLCLACTVPLTLPCVGAAGEAAKAAVTGKGNGCLLKLATRAAQQRHDLGIARHSSDLERG